MFHECEKCGAKVLMITTYPIGDVNKEHPSFGPIYHVCQPR